MSREQVPGEAGTPPDAPKPGFTITNPDVQFDDDRLRQLVEFVLDGHAKRSRIPTSSGKDDPPTEKKS